MSKAEKRAHECYPDDDVASIQSRFGFLLGYQQAEKDLELTLEDMRELHIIFAEIDVDIELYKTNIKTETLGYYQEVLKRFKEKKGE